VYPGWANQVFLLFVAFCGMNNLRVVIILFGSIPTRASIIFIERATLHPPTSAVLQEKKK
jgi:hypothetical protein